MGSGRAATLADTAESRIEAEIIEGHLRPGDRLDEEELAARFSTSRTPVREALRSLASIGLVTVRPRAGATVSRPTVTDILELFELVAELEGSAARLACLRATPEQIAAIVASHAICECEATSGSASAYYRANVTFHRAIWAGTNNRVLAEEIARVDRRLSPYRRHITFHPGRQQASQSEHQKIAEALSCRDAETAEKEMRDHVMILSDDALQLARNLRL